MASQNLETEPISTLLRSDLAAFADPGEPVAITDGEDGWVVAEWTKNGRPTTANFRLGDDTSFGDTHVRAYGQELSYRSFLAGAAMGDLRAVARNTSAVLSVPGPFVSPTGVFGEEAEQPADDLIRALAAPDEDRTPVVFLTADAGDGKTTLMKQIAIERARAYLNGAGDQVWLYVDAQGSRLARLDQALAQALDEVRASFPYHATAPLVRVGALVLVVDGFDELIGTSGSYDEAYGSLSSFLASLAGAGSVVAVARSAYYEQEFATRVNRSLGFATESWELRPLRLLEWNPSQRRSYVVALAEEEGKPEDSDQVAAALEHVFADPELAPLAGKPLFVSRVARLLFRGDSLASGELPLDRLVNAYVDREVRTKLLSADGSPLISAATFRAVLEELAEEMWREETRSLSRSTVRELMGIFADLYALPQETKDVLVERLPYAAFLTVGHGRTGIAFQHELFFAYFLAQPLLEGLSSDSTFAVAQTLRRGRLPQAAAMLAGRALRRRNPELIVDRLSAASKKAQSPSARQNAAAVATGLLARKDRVRGINVRHMDFVDLDMRDIRLEDAVLNDVEMSGVDMRGTQVQSSRGDGVRIHDVFLDEGTKLELAGVPLSAVSSVVKRGASGALATYYAPPDIHAALREAGFPAAQQQPQLRRVDADVVDTLETLMRVYRRTNLITEDDEGAVHRATRTSAWPGLKDALLQSGVLREERRGASGNKTFLRLAASPVEVLAAQERDVKASDAVRDLWRRLEAAFPPR